MAEERIELTVPHGTGSSIIGAILFESPTSLTAKRALDGIRWDLPVQVQLDRDALRPSASLTRLDVAVSFNDVPVGTASAPYTARPGGDVPRLSLYLSAQSLRQIERLRDARAPTFDLEVRAELCIELRPMDPLASRQVILGAPQRLYRTLRITYHHDAWVKMLQATGYGESVFVEIGLDPVPSPDWEKVYTHVRNARDALLRGGREAYRCAMNETRDALEEWRKIRAPDMSQANAAQRTEAQRIDVLRADLHSLAHLAAHPHPDDHLRDRRRAVLLVATLAALLGVESP